MANPTLLTSPIAENGDKNVIPASTGATTGLLDQEHGFQQINELPLQAGGLPPQRKDFNGAFNLLSKLLFYVQKGWQFEYDENQDYYAGCVVKDTDGGLYCANTDVSASSTHPKDDTTNWALINFGFNKKETFVSSGSFTAPVTGTYRITLQGGGGGGFTRLNAGLFGGRGGGQGGLMTFYEKLVAGASYSYTIGAGGSYPAGVGGTSTVIINGTTYECYGGNKGSDGVGGEAKINSIVVGRGGSGGMPTSDETSGGINWAYGGNGGGIGGANSNTIGTNGILGGGGCGQTNSGSTLVNGTNGGDGYITFEYCDI